ncbi:hypothetical protein RMCBS344292_18218 [Rhizopus microsporus]|nr:hypothetical protein RMCBS344292_18218 [Rhizopus microsporus]
MENNKSPKAPTLCTAGCGFYGNELFNNMCSKCFKEATAKNEAVTKEEATIREQQSTPSSSSTTTTTTTTTTTATRKHLRTPSPEPRDIETTVPPSIPSPSESKNDNKPVQTNKGRCFKCRIKVPLAKQAANKCRCDYVFCDTHRYPDRHDCEIDYAKMDRELLAKNNPKLHERPKGGRSFQRIDSL